jgi:hypothetical protein
MMGVFVPGIMAGWTSTDEGAKHSYTVVGTTVPAAGSVTITSGTATGDLKWTGTNQEQRRRHDQSL